MLELVLAKRPFNPSAWFRPTLLVHLNHRVGNKRNTTWKLVAISAQRFVDHRLVALRQNASTTQVSLALLAHANGQVARASTAVLHFPISCDPKTFFGCLVRLHLGHKSSLFQKMVFSFYLPIRTAHIELWRENPEM